MIQNVAWFEKHKPKTIEEYVFPSENFRQYVDKWLQNGYIDGNLLLYGPAGTGKTALSSILIHTFIKDKLDLKIVKDKSTAKIDELPNWCVKQPNKSGKKIIYIEEFDRCHANAFNSLKDGMMEKYQQHVTFIATTNFINLIPHAVLTRFTYKLNAQNLNQQDTYLRLKSILEKEEMQFEESDLWYYVENNLDVGLRDLINNLQIAAVGSSINFTNIKIQKSEHENDLINNTMQIFQQIFKTADYNTKKCCLMNPKNSIIANEYNAIVEIVEYNYEINYEQVLLNLNDQIHFLPIKLIIDRYISNLHTKKFLHVHYIAFLYECIETILRVSL